MAQFESINPWTGETIETFETHTDQELEKIVDDAYLTFQEWKKISFESRASLMKKLAQQLQEKKEKWAKPIVEEMGKPIKEAIAEIVKCAWVCEYYADNAGKFLTNEIINTDASKSYIRHDPLGVVVAIMPWNYPFWQVLRFAAPTIMAGNVGILKHAENVSRCGIMIQELFEEAGFARGVFQSIIADNAQTKKVLENPKVAAATLTGSENAGKSVASTCGSVIKKTVLELGGSNAVIVLPDADLKKAAEIGSLSRYMNCGQSCIASKRFIVLDSVYDEFLQLFKAETEKFKIGDPADPNTNLSCVARLDLAEGLERQMNKSVEMGAEIFYGGQRDGTRFQPTILTNVSKGMPAYEEELFGPIASFIKASDEEEAIQIANATEFGLGAVIFSQNIEHAENLASHFEDGAVFINQLVKSDPRLPFGGTKKSGYGRELAKDGILEFVNRKTVYIQ